MHKYGRQVAHYADLLKRYVVHSQEQNRSQIALSKPLLFVSFEASSYSPDRQRLMKRIEELAKGPADSVFFEKRTGSHGEWTRGIAEHRFVLAPHGHGLDTHRVAEIIMLGGIPVMKKSSISSCYDDTDNDLRPSTGTKSSGNSNEDKGKSSVVISPKTNGAVRGGIPAVILNSWDELTKERLEKEWERISKVPQEQWDWRRAFLDQWLARIKYSTGKE
jgi:hypothetical protein